jgi:DNA-binding transcriptional MerR regulator
MKRVDKAPDLLAGLRVAVAGGDARLKIGDVAKATGRTVRALRLYEELGLLLPAARTGGGFRMYDESAVTRVAWIGKLQDLGFTLNAIQDLALVGGGSEPGEEAMARVRAAFRDKLAEVREQTTRLQALEGELTRSLQYLEGCAGCRRGPVHTVCRACQEPGHDEANTPSLVGGIRAGV